MQYSVLIFYEHLLTIDMERRAIRSRKMSAPTVLFYLNRYFLLIFGLALLLWGFVSWDEDSVSFVHMRSFSALRIHAINNYRWFWTVTIIVLGSLPFPINLVSGQTHLSILSFDIYGKGEPIAVAVAACQVLSESLVLAITWYRTAGIVIAARKTSMDVSLVSLLLRDGEHGYRRLNPTLTLTSARDGLLLVSDLLYKSRPLQLIMRIF
ncbi:hypothetical protein FKP32DRAFT_1575233 [Trametes sanguinea]|nr:hypothetical protein FKP32DRAFT_1575233 [Trametes sanguinea]